MNTQNNQITELLLSFHIFFFICHKMEINYSLCLISFVLFIFSFCSSIVLILKSVKETAKLYSIVCKYYYKH